MALCFIEPQDAIRVIAESVGREARRQLLGEIVRAWVDEIPENELASHYAKAVADLDEHDLSMLAAWHASLEVGHPIANREFLVNVFPSLGIFSVWWIAEQGLIVALLPICLPGGLLGGLAYWATAGRYLGRKATDANAGPA